MSALPAGLTPAIDTLRVCKVYAAFSNSPWADTADLAAAARVERRFPGIGARFRHAREFHARAALRAVECTARGVVFAAGGFPQSRGTILRPQPPNAHELAIGANPEARFAFADASLIVTAINTELLDTTPRVSACLGSLRDPEGLLAAPEIRDLPRPLHLQAQLSTHFWPADTARELVAAYGKLLPPRSVLLMTWGALAASARGRELAEMLGEVYGAPLYRHTAGDVCSWLEDAGFDILEPGVRDVRSWRAGWPHLGPESQQAPGRIMAVIARRP